MVVLRTLGHLAANSLSGIAAAACQSRNTGSSDAFRFSQILSPASQHVQIQLPVAHEFFDLGIAQAFGIACRQQIIGGLRLEERDHLRVAARAVFLIDLVNPVEPFLVERLLRRELRAASPSSGSSFGWRMFEKIEYSE